LISPCSAASAASARFRRASLVRPESSAMRTWTKARRAPLTPVRKVVRATARLLMSDSPNRPESNKASLSAARARAGSKRSRLLVYSSVRCGMGVSCGGQRQYEYGTAVGRIVRAQRAAVTLDDGQRNGQTEAEAFAGRLGGVKRFEKMVTDFIGQAGTMIADFDGHPVANTMGIDFEQRFRLSGHCIQPVAQQVEQHLLQAAGFGDQQQVAGKGGDRNAGGGFLAPRFDDHQRVLDGAGDGDRLRRRRLLAGKGLQLADDAPGAVDQFA